MDTLFNLRKTSPYLIGDWKTVYHRSDRTICSGKHEESVNVMVMARTKEMNKDGHWDSIPADDPGAVRAFDLNTKIMKPQKWENLLEERKNGGKEIEMGEEKHEPVQETKRRAYQEREELFPEEEPCRGNDEPIEAWTARIMREKPGFARTDRQRKQMLEKLKFIDTPEANVLKAHCSPWRPMITVTMPPTPKNEAGETVGGVRDPAPLARARINMTVEDLHTPGDHSEKLARDEEYENLTAKGKAANGYNSPRSSEVVDGLLADIFHREVADQVRKGLRRNDEEVVADAVLIRNSEALMKIIKEKGGDGGAAKHEDEEHESMQEMVAEDLKVGGLVIGKWRNQFTLLTDVRGRPLTSAYGVFPHHMYMHRPGNIAGMCEACGCVHDYPYIGSQANEIYKGVVRGPLIGSVAYAKSEEVVAVLHAVQSVVEDHKVPDFEIMENRYGKNQDNGFRTVPNPVTGRPMTPIQYKMATGQTPGRLLHMGKLKEQPKIIKEEAAIRRLSEAIIGIRQPVAKTAVKSALKRTHTMELERDARGYTNYIMKNCRDPKSYDIIGMLE